jgi:cysteinyl-tRNA synthetase
MTHYAQPLDWTAERMAIAGANLHTFHLVGVRGLGLSEEADISTLPDITSGRPSDLLLAALMDDLNTPAAILSHLFSLVREADQKGGMRQEPAKQLLIDCRFMGLDPFRFFRTESEQFQGNKELIAQLIEKRTAARQRKDFAESDRIRDQLAKMGVVLKDSKDGTTWEIAR